MRNLILAAAISICAITPVTAQAEIEKTAALDNPKCQGLCLYWWPKLTIPAGWHQELEFSHKNNINFLVPDDERVNVGIYAGALQTKGQAETLVGFIADDREMFTKTNSGMLISDGEVISTADGQALRTLVFIPAHNENWDITAYGEEFDKDGNRYYLTFSLSAPSQAERDKYLPVLRQIINAYHK